VSLKVCKVLCIIATFLEQYLLCLSDLGWNAFSRWTDQDRPDLNVLQQDLGECTAPVAVTLADTDSYSNEKRHTEAVSTFIDRLRAIDAKPQTTNRPIEGAYLKDFHFVQQAPVAARNAYKTPECFKEDFLNWWWSGGACNALEALKAEKPYVNMSEAQSHTLRELFPREDDFRFLYLGMAGTGTGLHHDVVCSHSWSAQLAGYKLWTMFEPEAAVHLICSATGDCVVDDVWSAAPADCRLQVQDLVGRACAAQRCSLPAALQMHHEGAATPSLLDASVWSRAFVAVQPPQTAMFVPSGWYHQVHNLTRSLSINHNWFDSSALASVCAFVVAEAIEVRKRIADCQTAHLDIAEDVQFGVLCERVMRADIRCNIAQFCLLLSLLHGLLKPGPAADLRPLLHDPSTVGKAIDECAGLLAAEPLVQMSMAAAQDEQLRESMVKHGLCIVACFIGDTAD